jgi:hypothetical protein
MPSHVISIEVGISTSRLWVNIEHFDLQEYLLAGVLGRRAGRHAKSM